MNEEMHSPRPAGDPPQSSVAGASRGVGRLLGAVGGAGLLIGAVVVALSGAASADKPVLLEDAASGTGVDTIDGDVQLIDDGVEIFIDDQLGIADMAVFESYDQCLSDAGVPMFEAELSDDDGSVVDEQHEAAFDDCDPILDELSDDMFFEDLAEGNVAAEALSPEDEAVFDQHDECLGNAGLPILEFGEPGTVESFVIADGDEFSEGDMSGSFVTEELVDGEMDESAGFAVEYLDGDDMAELDEIFAECDPILDGLSDDVLFAEAIDGDDVHLLEEAEMIEFDAELDAAFEAFDDCLADAGIDVFDDDNAQSFVLGDDEIAVFESCETVFDYLDGEVVEEVAPSDN